MKKFIFLSIAAMMTAVAVAQNPTAEIEAKYEGKKGFVSTTLDASTLKMVQMVPGLDDTVKKLFSQTTEQKTLAVSTSSLAADFKKDCIAAFDKVKYTQSEVFEDAGSGMSGKAYAMVTDDKITEIVVIVASEKYAALQVFKGTYDKEMFEAATASATSAKK